MKKVFLIMVVIFFSQFALAIDIQVDSLNIITPDPLLENSDINIGITISSDADVNAFSLENYIDGELINTNECSIDINQAKTFYFITNSASGGKDYNYKVTIELDGSSDTNLSNNTMEIDFHVFKGVNITVNSLSLSENSVDKGEQTTVTVCYKNEGDVASGAFDSCFIHDSNNFYCWEEDSLGKKETKCKDALFTVPSSNGSIGVYLDVDNLIDEYIESDNDVNVNFYSANMPDLVVTSLTVPIEVKTGEEFDIIVEYKNIGGSTAIDFNVSVYLTSIPSGNRLDSKTLTLEPKKNYTWYIPYTPYSEGIDDVIALIDGENIIFESDEGNNEMKKSFLITGIEKIEGKSYTAEFQIRKDCQSLLSNGDRIIAKDFDTNSVSLKIIDSIGSILFEETVENGFEKVTPGRTIRVISISKTLARIIIVYQSPISMVYNECIFDAENVAQINESLTVDVRELQERLLEEETKYSICRNQIDTNSNEFEKCVQQRELAITDYDLCLKDKESISNDLLLLKADLSGKDNECTNRVVERIEECDISKDNLKEDYEEQRSDDTIFSMVGYVLFFSLSGIWAFDYRKRKTGKGF